MRPWQAGLCGHSSRDCERSREREPRLQGETGTQERPAILAGAGADGWDGYPQVLQHQAASFWVYISPCVTRIPERQRALLDPECRVLSSRKAFFKTQADVSL